MNEISNFKLNKVYCMDCLVGLKKIPDNSFDLLFTDPPYFHGNKIISSTQKDKYDSSWDKELSQDYFNEMLRVSKNGIIFGAEHLSKFLPRSRGWIVCDKRIKESESNDFSDCEIIWTSFNNPARIIRYLWNGFRVKHKEKRFHPTQKPLPLCIDLLKKFTKESDLILDPFMGSGTTAVACKSLNLKFLGFEKEKKYFDIINYRLKQTFLPS